jgi:hemin uptake protein HemP
MSGAGESSTNGLPSQRPGGASAGASERREVESTTLLAGGRELLIRHGGEVYTLRQTSKGKLILTK